MVEPTNPFERGDFNTLERSPWTAPMDELRFVKAVEGLGERIVVAVANAADRGLDTGVA